MPDIQIGPAVLIAAAVQTVDPVALSGGVRYTVPVQVIEGPPGPAGDDADATALLTSHEIDPTPHPAYDDMPSLTLIFENGLL